MPFGPNFGEFLAWKWYGGGNKLREEVYAKHDLYAVDCFCIGPETYLQTAFMTPPFGATLFYMKGTAPPCISMGDVFRANISVCGLAGAGPAVVHLPSGHQLVAAAARRLLGNSGAGPGAR